MVPPGVPIGMEVPLRSLREGGVSALERTRRVLEATRELQRLMAAKRPAAEGWRTLLLEALYTPTLPAAAQRNLPARITGPDFGADDDWPRIRTNSSQERVAPSAGQRYRTAACSRTSRSSLARKPHCPVRA